MGISFDDYDNPVNNMMSMLGQMPVTQANGCEHGSTTNVSISTEPYNLSSCSEGCIAKFSQTELNSRR